MVGSREIIGQLLDRLFRLFESDISTGERFEYIRKLIFLMHFGARFYRRLLLVSVE